MLPAQLGENVPLQIVKSFPVGSEARNATIAFGNEDRLRNLVVLVIRLDMLARK